MIFTWHNLLGMEKHDAAWHENDIADELAEYEQAEGFMERWSEVSDVVYTYTRAKWSGYSEIAWPLPRRYFVWGSLYMFPKYSLRWLFFRIAGMRIKSQKPIREVRNPAKLSKLDEIAKKYSVDPERFRIICQGLLKHWILLK